MFSIFSSITTPLWMLWVIEHWMNCSGICITSCGFKGHWKTKHYSSWYLQVPFLSSSYWLPGHDFLLNQTLATSFMFFGKQKLDIFPSIICLIILFPSGLFGAFSRVWTMGHKISVPVSNRLLKKNLKMKYKNAKIHSWENNNNLLWFNR